MKSQWIITLQKEKICQEGNWNNLINLHFSWRKKLEGLPLASAKVGFEYALQFVLKDLLPCKNSECYLNFCRVHDQVCYGVYLEDPRSPASVFYYKLSRVFYQA